MKIILLLFCCLVWVLYASLDVSSAYALSEVQCRIQATPYMYPVYYNGDKRTNPDNSFYPGDGFHYLFKYSADDTCIGFSVGSLQSGGAVDVLSHDIVGNSAGLAQNQSHESYDIIPKYFTVFNYYKVLDVDTNCIVHRGGTRSCSTNYTLSENPVFSYREDDPNVQSIAKKVDYYRKHSDKYQKATTGEWGLAKILSEHTHENAKHVFEDSESILAFDKLVKDQCSNMTGKKGCVFGHAEINPQAVDRICLLEELSKRGIDPKGANDECIDNPNNLSIKITGYKKVFETTKTGKVILKQVKVSSGASATPNMRADDIDIIFENPPINDIDGYDSKNQESNYYVNDFPSIHVQPNLPFRDVRNNTLTFVVSRINTPLDEIFTDNCKNKSCLLNAENSFGNVTKIESINGDRIDVFEPKSFDELGIHEIKYNVKLSNINRLIQDTDGETELFVVDYDPKFGSVHPFVNWNSVGKTSLDKLHSIGIHYLGSQGSGTNNDDSELHELRRAKINDYYHAFFGQTFDVKKYINEMAYSNATQFGTIPYFKKLMIDISYINVTATQHGGSDVLSKRPHPSVSAVMQPSWDDMTLGISPSMISKTNSTAVFEREGYGRLWVKFDNLADQIDQKTLVNATVYGTTSSNNFGGYDKTYLNNYKYLFPHSPTNLLVNATGIHSDGTINADLEISVTLSPYLSNNNSTVAETSSSNNNRKNSIFSKSQIDSFEDAAPYKTVYIPRYFQEHAKIAGIENGNVAMQIADFHDITNTATYTGTEIVSMNKSIIYIPERLWEMLEITNDDDFFRYPEYVSSNVPGLYVLQIDANENTKKYPAKQYAFNEHISEFINIDQDNTLDTIRFGDVINIITSNEFGNISSIHINNTKIDRHCSNGCFFVVRHDDTVNIDAYNIWDGKASGISRTAPPMNIDQEFSMLEKTLDSYLPHILITATFFFSYTIIKRASKRK